jgi:hypothetical protein
VPNIDQVLKPLTPEEQFPKTEQKIGGFRAGKGTVRACLAFVKRHLTVYAQILCYEDPEPVEGLRKAFRR